MTSNDSHVHNSNERNLSKIYYTLPSELIEKKFHFEVIDVKSILRMNMKIEMIMETKLYLANTVCITSGITYKIILNSKIYDMVLCQV